jgi:MATE family multidrug resistance protein
MHYPRLFDRPAMLALMKANGDIFICTLCLTFGFAYFNWESARFGEVVLAVNTILLHLQNLMA